MSRTKVRSKRWHGVKCNKPANAGKESKMSNQELVAEVKELSKFLLDPAKQRPDEFKNHGIVAEFAQRAGWVGHTIDWTNLFLTEKQVQSLEQLIEAQGALADEGLTTTPKEIFDAAETLFNRGKTAFSHTELGEAVKEQRRTRTSTTNVYF